MHDNRINESLKILQNLSKSAYSGIEFTHSKLEFIRREQWDLRMLTWLTNQ